MMKTRFKLRRFMMPLLATTEAPPALSFDLVLAVLPVEIVTDHPDRIIGVARGADYKEIEAAANARGIPFFAQSGVLTVRNGATPIGLNVRYAFQTTGYDNPYLYQNVLRYELTQGFLSTDATGNVAIPVSRNLRSPLTDAPSLEALCKQVINAGEVDALLQIVAVRHRSKSSILKQSSPVVRRFMKLSFGSTNPTR